MTKSLNTIMADANNPKLLLTPKISEWILEHHDRFTPEAMNRVWEELTKPGRERSGSFSASSAGTCLRRQELTLLGKEQATIFPSLQETFTLGTFMHAYWQMRLLSANLIDDIEVSLDWPKYNSKGSADGVGHVWWEPLNPAWAGLDFGLELKALHIDEKILTPTGWRRNGDLSLGDKVIGQDGKETDVLAIEDHHNKQMYRVFFNDKTFVDTTKDHLWSVKSWSKDGSNRIITTEQLMNECNAKRYDSYHTVPLIGEYSPSDKDYVIDPYTMGALLGDGQFKIDQVFMHNNDMEVFDYIKSRYKTGNIRYGGCHFMSIHNLLPYLRSVDLEHKKSWEKFVPPEYFCGSYAQRLAILQGLLDTDGTIDKIGRIDFTSASKQLSNDVASLVRSLGGIATEGNPYRSWYTDKDGTRTMCREVYTVAIRNMPVNPFYITRKRESWDNTQLLPRKKKRTGKNIVNVQPVGVADARCIKVANKDGLYVTKDYIVTHNSVGGFAWTKKAEEGPDAGHLAQMHRYMLVSGIRLFVYIIMDKSNQSGRGWKEFVIEADPKLLEESEQELIELNKAEKNKQLHPLLPGCSSGTSYVYKMCPFKGRHGACKTTKDWND